MSISAVEMNPRMVSRPLPATAAASADGRLIGRGREVHRSQIDQGVAVSTLLRLR